MLNVIDSFNMLKGFPLANWQVLQSESDMLPKFPFWLKANISLHKTEQRAVLKCNNQEEARKNFFDLKNRFPRTEIIAQEQIDGIEMIIGIKKDAVFNKLLLMGAGGVFAETIKDTSFIALPASGKEIEAGLKQLKIYSSLVSRKKFATDKFINLAEKISKLNISEADFNPVVLNEQGAFIIDSRIEV